MGWDNLQTTIDNVNEGSDAFGEDKDCGVCSIAIFLRTSYTTAWLALFKEGRVYRNGTNIHMMIRAVYRLAQQVPEVLTRDQFFTSDHIHGVALTKNHAYYMERLPYNEVRTAGLIEGQKVKYVLVLPTYQEVPK